MPSPKGGSTLMTSAPIAAIIAPQHGAAIQLATSSTLIPARGAAFSASAPAFVPQTSSSPPPGDITAGPTPSGVSVAATTSPPSAISTPAANSNIGKPCQATQRVQETAEASLKYRYFYQQSNGERYTCVPWRMCTRADKQTSRRNVRKYVLTQNHNTISPAGLCGFLGNFTMRCLLAEYGSYARMPPWGRCLKYTTRTHAYAHTHTHTHAHHRQSGDVPPSTVEISVTRSQPSLLYTSRR